MKKYLIATAALALFASPTLAQDVNNPPSTTKGQDAATSQPAPPPVNTGVSTPTGDVNKTKATTQGEDKNTTGVPAQPATGAAPAGSAPGAVATDTDGGIANPAAPDAANPVAGKGSQ